MDRRTFIAGGLVIAHSAAHAQSEKVYHVGFLLGATRESVAPLFDALREGMRELGYVEGRHVVFEQRYGGGKMERLPNLAAELVRLRPDVIVTGTNIHVAAVRQATQTIPIVMVFAFDPVRSGFVASLARPGGNVTGLSADSSSELWAKYLAMLKELVPNLSRVGVIGQKSVQVGFAELEQASRKLDLTVDVADIRTAEGFDSEFAGLVSKRVGALLIIIGPLTYLLKERIADVAIRHRLPAITDATEYAQAGVLMSYGPYIPDLYRSAATYVDKILRGASPADLPVEQPTKLQLIINLKTAKALNLAVPQSLLLRADEVIQ
ncbi:MAG TPA: ABC transporter substrate-binding protein [Casimicrobiaceae bacterium]|nr:ABC transporter substrate-binding protein [Casimicrobiaceae bacterium]